MAFDGITTKAVVSELQDILIGGKINKIYEPNKNEILLHIYNKKNYILLLSSNPDYCRINLTNHTKPNPKNAPNFCMLLRKYLIGAKIIDISTYDLERTVEIKLEAYNELNDLVIRKIFIQIMNRQSNIILTNENNIIIDSLKHFDNTLPAHPFEFVKITKKSFLELQSENEFISLINNQNLLNILPNIFIGFSKDFVKLTLEILKINEQNYSNNDLKNIYHYIKSIINNFGTNNISLKISEKAYSIVYEKQQDLNINYSIDEFYYQKEQESTFFNSRNNLLHLVSSQLKKVYRKLENINEKLKECENMDTYKLYGELLTANLYRLPTNENLTEITLNNYYANSPITIPLDSKINLSKNIEKYYKKYNKLKNALSIVSIQKQETEKELDYIESIVFSLENAKSIDDIIDVYNEISENIFTKKEIFKNEKNKSNLKNKRKEKDIKLQSIEIDGFTVYIGKNNIQNDYLSLKFANKNDIWFHTQKIHGSHILLRNPENIEIQKDVLEECAKLAKENSKGKQSSNVPVDYCLAKYVKKSPGAKPGLVIYTHYKTMFVK